MVGINLFLNHIEMEKGEKSKSVIARSNVRRIKRATPSKNFFMEESEVQAAYAQVGDTPNRNTKSWYRDIYEFYQNNEC